MTPAKKVGILYHPLIEAASVLARKLGDFLTASGVDNWLGSSWEAERARARMPGTDLLLSVGGDGTILRSVQVAIGTETPITGVNLGKLGFMTELPAEEVFSLLPNLLAGEGWIDERAMLEVKLPVAGTEDSRTYFALNDVVVARGAIARVINIDTTIDGEPFTSYTADGVIVASATGSTGYSLAAGGPILHPSCRDFVLQPILPHLSLPYALVLPPGTVVRLGVTTPYAGTLSIDGHTNLPLPSGSVVTVRESESRTRFLRLHPEASFFTSLEQKLRGKRHA